MTALSPSTTVSVIGAGTMGAGIAQVAAAYGHDVLLFDADDKAVARGMAGIEKFLGRSVEKGRMAATEKDAIVGRIKPAKALAELAPSSLVIEAIVERLDVKQSVFGELEGIVGKDCILASNTSSLSITAMGAALERPEKLVGMHFFNPAPLMRLVEVVLGLATSDDTKQTVFDTAGAWGKKPVFAKSTPGFIANRIARPFYGESLRLMEEGAADAVTIDAVMKDCGGFRMGPFELMDLVGTDVNLTVTKSVWEAFYYDNRYQPSLLQEELVAAGRFGRKSGHGWYPYGEGAEKPAPAAAPQGPKPKRVIVIGDAEQAMSGADPATPIDSIIALALDAGIEVEAREIDRDFDYAAHRPETGDPDDGDAELTGAWEEEEDDWVPGGSDPFDMFDAEPGILLDGAILRPVTMLPRGIFGDFDSWEDGGDHPTVWFDICLDYKASPRIAISAPDGAPRTAILAAAGFFQALGKEVTVVADVPGLVLMRVVAMLANEAAEAVYTGVCDAAGADAAMLHGLNYPVGPLAWAESIGYGTVVAFLTDLFDTYRDPRYRVSRGLVRLARRQRQAVVSV